jgi:cell division protein FtsI (penicillin-binding protein 3)
MVNGGTLVKPTVLKQPSAPLGERIISEETSRHLRGMMRRVVTEGTARMGDVPGYSVAGKTGTADKPSRKVGIIVTKFWRPLPVSFQAPIHAMF